MYICQSCKTEINSEGDFCPICGFKNDKKVEILPFSKKLKIYTLSVFLAPFGVIWFIKYFKNPNPSIRKVGYFALIITMLSFVISIITIKSYVGAVSKYTDAYQNNLNIYTELGY